MDIFDSAGFSKRRDRDLSSEIDTKLLSKTEGVTLPSVSSFPLYISNMNVVPWPLPSENTCKPDPRFESLVVGLTLSFWAIMCEIIKPNPTPWWFMWFVFSIFPKALKRLGSSPFSIPIPVSVTFTYMMFFLLKSKINTLCTEPPKWSLLLWWTLWSCWLD